jgi:hypothetical protein
MESANLEIELRSNQLNYNLANALVQPTPGKDIEHMALMKDPVLKPLWRQGFGNEIGRLFEVICDKKKHMFPHQYKKHPQRKKGQIWQDCL